jgi:hypothetical protein
MILNYIYSKWVSKDHPFTANSFSARCLAILDMEAVDGHAVRVRDPADRPNTLLQNAERHPKTSSQSPPREQFTNTSLRDRTGNDLEVVDDGIIEFGIVEMIFALGPRAR